MKIKMLAIDLDGTFLTHERLPHPKSVEAVRRAVEAGVVVVLASGRIRPSMLPYAQQIGLKSPMISSNGAHVTDEDGRELHHDGLHPSQRDLIFEHAQAVGRHLNLYCRDELFFLFHSEWGDLYRSRLRFMEPKLLDDRSMATLEPTKMMLVGAPADLARDQALLWDRLDPALARMTISEPEYLEFLSPNADKGTALRLLAKRHGFEQGEVAAIGDYLNDLEMISWAGLSGAPSNAAPEIRQIAHHTVGSNEEGAVADFVDLVLAQS